VVQSHALSVEITKADTEEIVLSSHENDLRRLPSGSQHGSSLNKTSAIITDIGDGEGHEISDLPVELSKAALAGSRLFMVWDPKRVKDPIILDFHT
jgi:hypothetical protein